MPWSLKLLIITTKILKKGLIAILLFFQPLTALQGPIVTILFTNPCLLYNLASSQALAAISFTGCPLYDGVPVKPLKQYKINFKAHQVKAGGVSFLSQRAF